MTYSCKFILYYLFSLKLLCMSTMSNGKSCNYSESCKSKIYITRLSIKFPFDIRDKLWSCGTPGFSLYCDAKLGALLELPNAGKFVVESISYDLRRVTLSDPNHCLPQKLLSLDGLSKTPFRPIRSKDFWVYNCSGVGDHYNLDNGRIACLSGSDYTVVSRNHSINDSSCTLVKILPVPGDYYYYYVSNLLSSSYSDMDLTWDEQKCERSCDTEPSARKKLIFWAVVGTAILIPIIILMIYCWSHCHTSQESQTNGPSTPTTTDTSTVPLSQTLGTRSPIISSGGLDQLAIDSYPTVILGENGRLIEADDDTCAICLSEYSPQDTLKLLPVCLHRFHADCIDQWLRSKATCPICRIFPHNSSAF